MVKCKQHPSYKRSFRMKTNIDVYQYNLTFQKCHSLQYTSSMLFSNPDHLGNFLIYFITVYQFEFMSKWAQVKNQICQALPFILLGLGLDKMIIKTTYATVLRQAVWQFGQPLGNLFHLGEICQSCGDVSFEVLYFNNIQDEEIVLEIFVDKHLKKVIVAFRCLQSRND